MPEAEDDLRATSDSILSDTERLASLEERKQRLDPPTRSSSRSPIEIEALTERIGRKATAERETRRGTPGRLLTSSAARVGAAPPVAMATGSGKVVPVHPRAPGALRRAAS